MDRKSWILIKRTAHCCCSGCTLAGAAAVGLGRYHRNKVAVRPATAEVHFAHRSCIVVPAAAVADTSAVGVVGEHYSSLPIHQPADSG